MFVVGAGLSTLETGADNFLAMCGPPRYSEIRLSLTQGIWGVGSFVAPLLASKVFFLKMIDYSRAEEFVIGVSGCGVFSCAVDCPVLFRAYVAFGSLFLPLKLC